MTTKDPKQYHTEPLKGRRYNFPLHHVPENAGPRPVDVVSPIDSVYHFSGRVNEVVERHNYALVLPKVRNIVQSDEPLPRTLAYESRDELDLYKTDKETPPPAPLWLPTVYSNCELGRRQDRPRPPFESRRKWRFPGPARRPKNVTTEEPFNPRKENVNFTGTPHVDDICTTKEKPPIPTTTLFRVSFTEDCDYLAFYCMRAYVTGAVCGRTLYYQYESFENYCMLDYVNCMERYEVWKVVHMGKCFVVDAFKDYEQYSYKDDYYLRHMVVKVWLPTVYNGCALSGRRHVRRKPPYENRRQWKFPRPARRPKNVTTEAPFEPQREDEEKQTKRTIAERAKEHIAAVKNCQNFEILIIFRSHFLSFTGTTHVDDQCSTKERAIELTTTLLRVSFTEDCDYLAFYCMRAYEGASIPQMISTLLAVAKLAQSATFRKTNPLIHKT
ncbi:hypothetical protein MSG28_014354 [Choristoneura fumiferana]|uniref:Uncharacterized protein n=1 Tax=Choristoneura fumiferana TaxID=7141 RepID=A0ACC0JHM6_CHOFU|nr:hypothetical protein MSG28_014354 [Choristoneura fumiferana]